MSEKPAGQYDVSVVDVSLPPLRARLFYPTANASVSALQAPWLPPSESFPHETITNVLRFANIPFASALAMPLHTVGTRTIPAAYGAPLLPPQILPKLPVHIFSHGLGGSTGGYNHICMELASCGHVVVAPEHSDGSAFLARVDGEEIGYARYNPLSHGPSELGFRRLQLQTRVTDLEKTLRNMGQLNTGKLSLQTLPGSPKAPSFVGRLDLEALHACGHSFGGATVLAFAKKTSVKAVTCLDAWLRSLLPEVRNLDVGPAKLLFVDQELSNMRESIAARERLPRMSQRAICDAVLVEEATHNNASDFALRVPKWIAIAAGMTKRGSDPLLLLKRQGQVVLEFLHGDWREFRERISSGDVPGIRLAPLGKARYLGSYNEMGTDKRLAGTEVEVRAVE